MKRKFSILEKLANLEPVIKKKFRRKSKKLQQVGAYGKI